MNITRILPYFAGCALLMASCANEDLTPDMHQGSSSVKFTLGGSAKKKSTRATVADEDKESHISNVLAVLFDKETGFYKTVEANGATNGQYEFNVERDGSYDIYFVANADAALKAKLQGITAGTKITGSDNVLENIIATQDPGADNEFPMFCTAPASVDKLIVKDEKDLGTIAMRRLAARFDIINNAPGITVTGITLKNSAKQSSLAVRNAEDADADASEWYTDKRYDASTAGWPADFKCEMTADAVVPVKFEQTIYSYENLSGTAGFSATNRPVIEVEYLEEDGQTKRTHDIELKEPKSGEILALQRNHLYRITLNYEYDLDFDLTVLDWDDSETFEYPDIPIITEPENPLLSITPEQQQEMNSRLIVKGLTIKNYKLDISNRKLSNAFCGASVINTSDSRYPQDFIPFGTLYSTGMLNTGTKFTQDDSTFEFLTLGDVQLLFPIEDDIIKFNNSNVGDVKTINESVYLKNNSNGTVNKSININQENEYGFKGASEFYIGNNVVYGIRFKGTKQHAAYKWEYGPILGDPKYQSCLSIWIKALPENIEVDINDIVDNDDFFTTPVIYKYILLPGYGATDVNGTNDPATFTMLSEYRKSTILVTNSYSSIPSSLVADSYVYSFLLSNQGISKMKDFSEIHVVPTFFKKLN